MFQGFLYLYKAEEKKPSHNHSDKIGINFYQLHVYTSYFKVPHNTTHRKSGLYLVLPCGLPIGCCVLQVVCVIPVTRHALFRSFVEKILNLSLSSNMDYKHVQFCGQLQ